jgi:proline dehydrogenase
LLGRALLWAADKPRIERWVTEGKLTRKVVKRFVAGDTLEDAIKAIKDLNESGIGGILDLLGEGVSDPAGATEAAEQYRSSIRRIEETGIDTTVSLKPTQLGLAFDKDTCIEHFRALAVDAQRIGVRLEIDMEQIEYVSDTLDVHRAVRAGYEDVRLAIQAYLRRTASDLESLRDLKPKIRLVKGAYSEDEAVAYQRKKEIEQQYLRLTDWLFENGTDPGIATHDSKLIDHAREVAERTGAGKQGFEIQMLYGIRRDLQAKLADDGFRVRVYVPFGSAWYPYLMRRMAERPANLRFFLRALASS